MEKYNLEENNSVPLNSENMQEEYTPKLFSEDQNFEEENLEKNENELKETEQLFDQDINEEEDFEIPALRKQNFNVFYFYS